MPRVAMKVQVFGCRVTGLGSSLRPGAASADHQRPLVAVARQSLGLGGQVAVGRGPGRRGGACGVLGSRKLQLKYFWNFSNKYFWSFSNK